MLRRLLLTAAVSAATALSWAPGATAGTPSDAPGVSPVPVASPAGPATVFTGGPSSLFPGGVPAPARTVAAYGLVLLGPHAPASTVRTTPPTG